MQKEILGASPRTQKEEGRRRKSCREHREVSNSKKEVPLIRMGRHFKKWHPTNKTLPKQKQEEQKKGSDVVSTRNSLQP